MLAGAFLMGGLGGCRYATQAHLGPPDARRPVVKSEAELAAERDERIRSGQIVPTTEPADPLKSATPARPPLVPMAVSPGAIEADILLVNDSVVTLAEVLYPLRERIAEVRRTQTREGFVEVLQRLIRARIQQEVGAILIHKQAIAELSDQQHDVVKKAIDSEVQSRIARDFGGSTARFEHELTARGLTVEQFRTQLERDLVARQYTREKLLPQITVTRDELLAYYRQNPAQFASEETRELYLLEAPFEAFLPAGTTWAQAGANVRAQAKLKAARQIRAAHAALADRPFEEVAREQSHGVHAGQGGAWGVIARPLQPPYEKISAQVFKLEEGQYGEPVETEQGWYIVRCGTITPAQQVPFTAAQADIRQQLTEKKFERLAADYMIKLSENATVSGMEAFMRAALRRVTEDQPASDAGR